MNISVDLFESDIREGEVLYRTYHVKVNGQVVSKLVHRISKAQWNFRSVKEFPYFDFHLGVGWYVSQEQAMEKFSRMMQNLEIVFRGFDDNLDTELVEID